MSDNQPSPPPRRPWRLSDWVRAPLLLIAMPVGTAIGMQDAFGGSVASWMLGFAAGLVIGGCIFAMYRQRDRRRR